MVTLTDLSPFTPAIVERIEPRSDNDPIARRLVELGFVPGEAIHVIAVAPISNDPIVTRIGSARFALRLDEARRIKIRTEGGHL
ncbi:ferrous iron transport protein A [Lysobacter sp. HDW10]|nr:ferrous iron transport protein A [Lysobacter sp. HDW10]